MVQKQLCELKKKNGCKRATQCQANHSKQAPMKTSVVWKIWLCQIEHLQLMKSPSVLDYRTTVTRNWWSAFKDGLFDMCLSDGQWREESSMDAMVMWCKFNPLWGGQLPQSHRNNGWVANTTVQNTDEMTIQVVEAWIFTTKEILSESLCAIYCDSRTNIY